MYPVLVTYATRNGSTEEVARAVGETMRHDGLPVEIKPVKDVQALKPREAVVLCVPLYMGRLHRDARQFLSENRDALTKIPVALFVLGPVQNVEKDWKGAQQQLAKELAKLPWLSPVAQHIVGGKFDPAKLGFPFNFIMKKMPMSDVRDWTAIREFASQLAITLQPAMHR
jgi:menaquinone-dependent protoporphyrinogen oxidase